jgi:hypothetical protein
VLYLQALNDLRLPTLGPFVTNRTDVFCLYYDAKAKVVRGINASGRSPAALTLDYLRKQGIHGQSVSFTYLLLPREEAKTS